MENIIKIKNIKLGEGTPKICVPVIEKNEKEIIKYIKYINKLPIDIIEWRADFYLEDIIYNEESDFSNKSRNDTDFRRERRISSRNCSSGWSLCSNSGKDS